MRREPGGRDWRRDSGSGSGRRKRRSCRRGSVNLLIPPRDEALQRREPLDLVLFRRRTDEVGPFRRDDLERVLERSILPTTTAATDATTGTTTTTTTSSAANAAMPSTDAEGRATMRRGGARVDRARGPLLCVRGGRRRRSFILDRVQNRTERDLPVILLVLCVRKKPPDK